MKRRIEASRGPFGLWFTLQYQVKVNGKWRTVDTYRTRSLQKKPRKAEAWVFGFFNLRGLLTTLKVHPLGVANNRPAAWAIGIKHQ